MPVKPSDLCGVFYDSSTKEYHAMPTEPLGHELSEDCRCVPRIEPAPDKTIWVHLDAQAEAAKAAEQAQGWEPGMDI
jgi:hypothetical protein